MKILFIEDNPEFSSYAKSLLIVNGHKVTHFSTADELMELLKLSNELNFDLVILDIMLRRGKLIDKGNYPDLGIALYNKIREKNKEIKIIILTARSKSEIWNFFENDKYVKYHNKPIYSDTTKFFKLINNFEE